VTTAPAGTIWEIPHPNNLTFADLDDILAETGVDVRPDAGNRRALIFAAIVTWQLRRQGQTADLDTIYRTLTMGQIRFAADPTPPAATG